MAFLTPLQFNLSGTVSQVCANSFLWMNTGDDELLILQMILQFLAYNLFSHGSNPSVLPL